jgi:hypothetical protein
MAYGHIGAILVTTGNVVLQVQGTGGMPLLKLSEGIFAFFYRDSITVHGFIKTFPISAAGAIGANIDSYDWVNSTVMGLDCVTKVAGNVFAVLIRTGGNKAAVYTFTIAPDGTITHSIIGSVIIAAPGCDGAVNCIVRKPGTNVYVLSWTNNVVGARANIATVTINDDGSAPTLIDTLTLDGSAASGIPVIRYVTGDIFVITYRNNASGKGQIATISVDNAGNIGVAAITDQIVDNVNGAVDPLVRNVAGNVVAVFHAGSAGGMYIKTYSINGAGAITGPIDTFSAAAATILRHTATNLGQSGLTTYWSITYQGAVNTEQLRTIDIDTTGNIGAAYIDTKQVVGATYANLHAHTIKVRDDVNLYVSGWCPSPGSSLWVTAFDIDSPNPAGGERLRGRIGRRLLMG